MSPSDRDPPPEIGQLTAEAAHARDDIARPFPQAGQLAAARDRVTRLEERLRQTATPSHRSGDDRLLAVAVHMARIPAAAAAVASHQDGQPPSPATLSQCDFPVDNPLAGATSATGQATPEPESKHSAPPATSPEIRSPLLLRRRPRPENDLTFRLRGGFAGQIRSAQLRANRPPG